MKLYNQNRLILLFIITGLFLSFLIGCEKEDPVEPATLTTLDVSEVTSVSASSGGDITYDGGSDVTIRGILWGTSPNPTPENHLGITAEGAGTGMFTSEIKDLLPNTSYYLRAYAVNSIGISYGNEIAFKTEGVAATVETAAITEITSESAVGGGNVIDGGGYEIIEKGVVWSIEENPTLENHIGITTEGTGEGEFTSSLNELERITTYYVRAYAINEKGTSYGDQIEFTTEPEVPDVLTAEIFQITSVSAKAKGMVTDDGGLNVTSRGFIWSDFENPTINNNLGYTEEGNGLGEFTGVFADLVNETTYYVRAYAVNDYGIAYGNEKQFVTRNPQVVDIDGNIYQTIILHEFLWMAENLKVTHYNDGSPISKGLTDTEWYGTSSGAYAVYPNNDVDGIDTDMEMLMTYGALYNWMAATDPKGLCPAGWRLPTDEEWKETEEVMGMNEYELDFNGWRGTDQGGQLKSTRTAPDSHPRWNQPNTLAMDLFGYSSVPAGFREYYGSFSDFGEGAAWWTSTTNADVSAWYRSNLWDRGKMGRFYGWNNYGFSVRCIQELD